MKTLLKYCCIAIIFAACKKSSFLDASPDQSLVVPSSLSDLQALLDNDRVMNGNNGLGVTPSLGEAACTDYYVNEDDLYGFLSPLESNAYTWQQQVFNGEHILDWNLPYKVIFYANTALEGLNNIPVDNSNQTAWNNVKGSALFYRAFMFWQLGQIFASPYDSATAATDWGIPLRMKADINEAIQRATVAATYQQIMDDLTEALPLLPNIPLYATRPSKAAVQAMLSKVFLSMHNYRAAMEHANACIQLQPTLIDYNSVDTTVAFPFNELNEETIFYTTAIYKTITVPNYAITDTTLYNSYEENDLRKKVFFSELSPGIRTFSGSYGKYALFSGIAVDEMILTHAECYARIGNTEAALNDLNSLLSKRYRTGTFIPYTATTATEALMLIFKERRKELVMRDVRWTDLRRLNKEGIYTTALSRTVNGITYLLPPNDPRYTYPIPDEVISFNPGMPQNSR